MTREFRALARAARSHLDFDLERAVREAEAAEEEEEDGPVVVELG